MNLNYFLLFIIYCLFPLFLHAADQPALLLAGNYHQDIKLEQYWVSEKYDGIRAYWDGSQLLTRQGNKIHAPEWFTQALPSQSLDGELWAGRNKFQQTVSTVRKQQAVNEEWQTITYMIFDMPAINDSFDVRLEQLQALLTHAPSWIIAAPQWKVSSNQQLQLQLQQYCDAGAEGLMLHRGKARYRSGRSQDLLKLKPYQDAEAVVIGHKAGQGKYLGMMGSLLVELPSGLQFYLGTGFSNQQRRVPPPVGTVISFKYYGKTNKGIPRHASFLRIRSDQGW
ncbi:DNA ligase [Oceanicoccus sp. KOV_DT_Chl]|uniref:DNA ligase n=1 Tax=Oceanicoccus sp. KOV_DT_Chl TaxID=1904639 RepID=UPI000C7B1006|nr:DNA ligase [Oceanicoccus sp. KOV_DT_Chl]